MDFKKYIKKFGNKTFDEVPLNAVDACIIAVLSYANWDILCPDENNIFDFEIDSKNISQDDNKLLYKNCTMPSFVKSLLKHSLKSKRFGNFKVKYIENNRLKICVFQLFLVPLYYEKGRYHSSFG